MRSMTGGDCGLTIECIATPPTSRFAAFARAHPSPQAGREKTRSHHRNENLKAEGRGMGNRIKLCYGIAHEHHF